MWVSNAIKKLKLSRKSSLAVFEFRRKLQTLVAGLGLVLTTWGRRGLVLLHTSLLLVVIVKVTILAFTLGVD
jgi:hypothetical protein